MSKYVVVVEFKLELDHYEAFLDRVSRQARDSVELEDGCHQFDVCANAAETTVLLYEVYSDQAAFDLHLDSDHFHSFDTEVSSWIISKAVRTFNLKVSVQ